MNLAAKRYITNRDVTLTDAPWLSVPVPKGTVVTEYTGHTFGCVSNSGVACQWDGLEKQHVESFCELPVNALTEWPVQ
jgi:hypothetical protein